MEKLLNALIKNTPLALIVIGLFLILIGAAGGFEKFALRIDEPAWRIALAIMGAVVAGFGALLVWRVPDDGETSALAKECDLKISSPISGSEVDEHIRMAGTFQKKPPDNSVAVIERSSSTGYHWFKARPVFDDRSKRWSADCRVGGEPGGPARVLFVAVMGRSGEAFREYYFRVGNETKQWPGITTLPPDIIVCDEVMVRRKEPRP